MLRRAALAMATAVVVLLAGCGRSETAGRQAGAALPLSAQSTTPATVARVRAADFRRPLATYRRHVRRQLGHMLSDLHDLRSAVEAGDLASARAEWLRASAHYGRIGAAYGAFGAYDRAIAGRPAGLPGRARSPRFSGLHRIELALWERRSTRDAAPYAARLVRDVRRLRTRVADLEIEPLDYTLRVHEILEDGLHLDLTDERAPWSGSALVVLRAEVSGTQTILRTLEPLLARRDPSGVARSSSRALTRLRRALARTVGSGGALPRLDALTQRQRETISGLTADAAEQLAYLPGLMDPRPPRPKQAPLEASR